MTARTQERLAPVLVAVATVLVFWPALRAGFVGWDDPANLLDNPHFRGFDAARLRWMFSTAVLGMYQPLSWLSYALDYRLWGMAPLGYHLTNVLLHAANAVLFYLIGRRFLSSPWAAAASALFFSIHPLRVESVAWLTERRDVLSGMFYLLTVLCYLRSLDSGRAWRWASWAAYACALLSKIIVFTLPATLLILDVYPLKRRALGWRRLLAEKLPYVLYSLPLLAAGYRFQAAGSGGEMLALGNYGLAARAAQACYGLVFYAWKTIAPFGLIAAVDKPVRLNPLEIRYLASYAAVAAAGALAVLRGRRHPAPAAAAAHFVAALIPALGLVQFGHYLVADRYSYLPSLGWALLAGAFFGSSGRWMRTAAVLVLLALGRLTWAQCEVWHDSQSLWLHALAVDPRNAVALTDLAEEAVQAGNLAEALAYDRAAVAAAPESPERLISLGNVLLAAGDADGMIACYEEALRIRPDFPLGRENLVSALINRGASRAGMGLIGQAIDDDSRAAALSPRNAAAHFNWGNALSAARRWGEAAAHYREAVRLDPELNEARMNWGNALAAQGRLTEAEAVYRELVRRAPQDAAARRNWLLILSRMRHDQR